MTLDPEAKAYLDGLAGGSFPVTELTVAEARARMNASYAALFGPVDAVGEVDDWSLPRAGGHVGVRIYHPAEPGVRLPALVYLHGGGWVAGSLDSHDGLARALCARTPCVVVSVDYRLAPEHPFPAGLDDAWAATRWVAQHAQAIGADPARVAVAGDSAGGALAAAVALRARDAGVRLQAQVLACPVLDCDLTRPSYAANGAYGPSADVLRWFWDQYVGPGRDPAEPEASPLRALDLAGVAAAHVVVAEHDTLRDEAVAYAERLRAAGVPTALSEHAGMIHGFFRLGAVLGRAQEGLDDIAAALARAFGTA